jgi:hypothetical protein
MTWAQVASTVLFADGGARPVVIGGCAADWLRDDELGAAEAGRWVQSWLSAGWGLPSSGTVQIGGSLAAIAAPSVGNGM